jgi:hypothetical protein
MISVLTRAEKGSPLDWDEIDQNFTNLAEGAQPIAQALTEIVELADGHQEGILKAIGGNYAFAEPNVDFTTPDWVNNRIGQYLTNYPTTEAMQEYVEDQFIRTIIEVPGTTYQLELEDATGGSRWPYLRFTADTATTVIVPTNADVPFAVGSQVQITAAGDGTVTLQVAIGVTINSLGAELELAGKFANVTLVKVANDEWDLAGNL